MWPQFRTGLITLHLIAIVLKAIPAPEGGMVKRLAHPTVQAEIRQWSQNQESIGVDTTPKQL